MSSIVEEIRAEVEEEALAKGRMEGVLPGIATTTSSTTPRPGSCSTMQTVRARVQRSSLRPSPTSRRTSRQATLSWLRNRGRRKPGQRSSARFLAPSPARAAGFFCVFLLCLAERSGFSAKFSEAVQGDRKKTRLLSVCGIQEACSYRGSSPLFLKRT